MKLTISIGLFLAPLVFLIILLAPQIPSISPEGQKVLAVAAWMLIWWISETVELSVTALLPIVLFPLLGVMNIDQATAPYSNQVIFLFMGGFFIALALEKWKLHLRIALTIVRWTGTNADGIIFGFLLSTALMSMWISNTATTLMMLPIALSVVSLLQKQGENMSAGMKNFALALTLSIAYGANIGGIATLVGTPPNSVMAGLLNKLYGYEMPFGAYMLVGFPFAAVLLICTYFIMVKWIYPNRIGKFEGAEHIISASLTALGKITLPEKRVLLIFGMTAFFWIFRSYLAQIFPILKPLTDSGIAMAAAVSLFLIPSGNSNQKILAWKDTANIPWGVLLLFGGGLSLADGLEKSGLIKWVGEVVSSYEGLDMFWLVLIISLLILFATELLSNVALTTVFVPMVAAMAVGMGENPLLVVLPVTMASSCAFMLPMGTPPNAIVFASGYIKIPQMMRVGLWLNLVAVVLLMLIVYFLLPFAFDVEMGKLPEWAKK